MARLICLRLLVQLMRLAASRTSWTTGSNKPIRTAMMAMTTSNSIRVNADRHRKDKGPLMNSAPPDPAAEGCFAHCGRVVFVRARGCTLAGCAVGCNLFPLTRIVGVQPARRLQPAARPCLRIGRLELQRHTAGAP